MIDSQEKYTYPHFYEFFLESKKHFYRTRIKRVRSSKYLFTVRFHDVKW